MNRDGNQRLGDVSAALERVLTHNTIGTPFLFDVAEICCELHTVAARDGTRLATDLYLPPTLPAPVVVVRTPYGRSADGFAGMFLSFARRGYAVVSQDCRGTGKSEPNYWDYYVYEADDSFDLIEWITRQSWFGGFIGAFGGSYLAQTQWCMGRHPRMSTIVPFAGGLGFAINTTHLHMFVNAYSGNFGGGAGRPVHYTEMERQFEAETMASGFFNEPLSPPFTVALLGRYSELKTLDRAQAKRWLWERYCGLGCAQRVEFIKDACGSKNVSILEIESLPAVFGHGISHDALTLPEVDRAKLCRSIRSPILLQTAWYDWGLNDALATWEMVRREAPEAVRARSRLIIGPGAHNLPGYHEGSEGSPELFNSHRYNVELLLCWYEAVRQESTDQWPTVIFYLMGANEWRVADDWPPRGAQSELYLGPGGALTVAPPSQLTTADSYTYDPSDPTPTVGGSIVSYLYPVGSVDVSRVQERSDVLTYTTQTLELDLDVVGPLRMILYASSSAVDTDFAARLSDVFPDGRAIQLQNGVLRARYRDLEGEPELLEPGRIYRFEIDMWATANRFKAGHRLRVDISSADFPRFDRNSNRGGEPGDPIPARQTVYHDADHPSHLLFSVLRD